MRARAVATVLFYEKPGCINNTRQKRWLAASGHTVIARDLLAEPWTPATLRPFFGERPVAQWFNPSAPRVKSGEIDPAAFEADAALAAMAADPLLIRRPLMAVGEERRQGFEVAAVDAWIGLPVHEAGDAESCPRGYEATPCAAPAAITNTQE